MRNMIRTIVPARLAVLVLASLLLVGCGFGPDDQQMVEAAKKYLAEGKLREAAIELKNALQDNSSNAEARYILGGLDLDFGDTESAEKEFRRAGESGWPEGQARVGYARALINGNKFQNMLDDVEIKDSYTADERANLYALRAVAYAGLNDYSKSREAHTKAAAIDPGAYQVMKVGIQLQLIDGDYDAAEAAMKKAQDAYPDNQELELLKAVTAIKKDDQPGALAAYRRVIELDPIGMISIYARKARLGLARMEITNKQLDQAQAALDPLLKENSGEPQVNYIGGLLAYEQGKLGLAEERLLNVLKVAPDHAQTQLLYGTVSFAKQEYEQAAYYLAKYVSAVPGNLGARKLLGRTYMKLGRLEEARATFKKGLQDSGDDAELLALVGLAQLQGGDTSAGIEGLENAVKASPESAPLRNELVKAYISAGEIDNAIEQLDAMMAEGGDVDRTTTLLILAHLKGGHFDKAISLALEMLSRKPDDPDVLTLVGTVFAATDDRAEARKYFNKVLKLKPGDVLATLSLARIAELDDRLDDAETLYKSVVSIEADNTTALLALARLAEKQDKMQAMVDWLEKARTAAPRDIKSRMILTEYYLRKGQTKEAGILVKEALKIAPRDTTLMSLQIRVYMAEGQYNEALVPLNELVTRVPDSMFARVMLGETYMKLGQLDNSRRQIQLVLDKEQYNIPALALMTKLEQLSGNQEKALEYAALIQKTEPDLSIGYELAGDSWRARYYHSRAASAYSQAWERKPSAALATKLSEAYTRSGKPEQAVIPLEKWLADHPDDATVLVYLGMAYQGMGQDAKAVGVYEKALAAKPYDQTALNNLAWLYSQQDNPKALDLAERAYKANPEESGIQDTYGWILVQNGKIDKGRNMLKKAMERMSTVPEVRYHYAVALLKSGEEKQAREMLKKLLDEVESFDGRDDAVRLMK